MTDTTNTINTPEAVARMKRRCLARYDAPVDIRGEYSDRPDHRLLVRIDVNESTATKAIYGARGGMLITSADYMPYVFTLAIDDEVIAFGVHHYVTDAIRRWNKLADIFGYPYVEHDGYTLHVADSPEPEPEPEPAA